MAVLVLPTTKAQTLTIGTGTNGYWDVPISTYYEYSCVQMLYTASEIAAAGTPTENFILSVGFKSLNALSNNFGVTIYMKNVSLTQLIDPQIMSEEDMVYSGTLPSIQVGWNEIELDNPFEYDPSQNLLIVVNKTSGGAPGYTNKWECHTANNMVRKKISNDSACSPLVFWQNYSTEGNRANIQLTFGPYPTCRKPKNVTVSEITANSATVSWTANAHNGDVNAYQVACTNDLQQDPDALPMYYDVNGNSVSLTNLQDVTNYYVYVRTNCGNNDYSTWTRVTSFKTVPILETVGDSYFEDFENGSGGWDLINGTCPNAWAWGTAAHNGEGTHGLYISNDGGNTYAYTYNNTTANMVYATKLLSFEDGEYTFDYDWKANGESQYDYLRVALVPASVNLVAGTNPPSGVTYTSFSYSLPTGWIALDGGSRLNGISASAPWQNKKVTLNVAAGDYYMVLAWYNTSSGGSNPPAAVDNVSITHETCLRPTGLSVTDITANSATITWDAEENTTWQYCLFDTYDLVPTDNDFNVHNTTTNTFTRGNLVPEHYYYVYLRKNCGNEGVSQVITTYFHTKEKCPTPDHLTVSLDPNNTSIATLSWNENGSATAWQICLNEDTNNIIDANTNPFTLTGLTAEVQNTVEVRANCGGSDGVSYWSNMIDFATTDKVVVGQGTTRNFLLPTASDRNYALTEQIYTADEIGVAGTIQSIDFYHEGTATNYTRNMDIYLVHTTKSSFSNSNDKIVVTAADKVFSGNVTFMYEEWTTIELDTYFDYDGISNLALIVDDNTNSTSYGLAGRVYEAPNMALRYMDYSNNIDPTSSTSSNGYVLPYKNQIRLGMSTGGSTCSKPTGLAATLTQGNGTVATLSWNETGSATAWQICLNDDESNLIEAHTNPFTLTGLTPETAYTAKVRANCGGEDGVSNWSLTVNFKPTNITALTVNDGTTTNGYVPIYGYWVDNISKSQFIIPADLLADMINGTIEKITFYASNTSVDWGNARFEVYMKEVENTTFMNTVLVDWTTMEKVMNAGRLSINDNKMEVTFDVPYQYNGGNLMIGILETTTGTYKECSWYGVSTSDYTSLGGYNSSIYRHGFRPKTTIHYTPVACPKPTELAATLTPGNGTVANLSWTENGSATAWQICLNDDENNLIEANTNPFTLTGLTPETAYTAKVRANCGGEDGDSHWSNSVSFIPSTKLVIGSAAGTINCLPTRVYNSYSVTQQIYTAAEIGLAGTIQSVDFYNTSSIAPTRTLELYLVQTTKENFNNTNDWVSATTDNLVFSGSVTFASDTWTVINFDTPFEYDGTSNLVLIVCDKTGSYLDEDIQCATFEATGMALRMYSDAIINDPDGLSGYNGTVENVKNHIRLGIVPPACAAPYGVTVNPRTIENKYDVSWLDNNENITYNIRYKKTTDDEWMTINDISDTHYLLSGRRDHLVPATEYMLQVQSKCGEEDSISNWSSNVYFVTKTVTCESIFLCDETPSYTEDFEDVIPAGITTDKWTGFSPACWTWNCLVNATDTIIPQLYRAFAHSGSYSMRMQHRGIYAMPELELDYGHSIQEVRMSFWMRNTCKEYTIEVGIVNSLENLSTSSSFVSIAEHGNTTTAISKYELNFSNYVDPTNGSGPYYIVFKNKSAWENVGDVYSVIYLDDITLSLNPYDACALLTVPYTENFEGYTVPSNMQVDPDCWSVAKEDAANYKDRPSLHKGFSHSGEYSLRMKDRCLYAMPRMSGSVDLRYVHMGMYLRQPNSVYTLQVGVMTDLLDESSYTPVVTLDNAGTGVEYVEFDFSDYRGAQPTEGFYIVFRNTLKPGYNMDYSYNYIDDIDLSYMDCGISSLPWSESFESYTDTTARETGVAPDCWRLLSCVKEKASTRPQLYRAFATEGSYSLRMSNRSVYALPKLASGIDLSNAVLEFDLRQPNASYLLEVGVMGNIGDMDSYKKVTTINNEGTGITHVTVDFSGFNGDLSGRYLVFKNTLKSGYTMDYSYNYIDNIVLYDQNNVPAPVAGRGAMVDEESVDYDNAPRGVEDATPSNLTIYPNPTTGTLNLSATAQRVEVYSQIGSLMAVYENVNQLNISNLSEGIYFLRVTMPEGVAVRKVVKR